MMMIFVKKKVESLPDFCGIRVDAYGLCFQSNKVLTGKEERGSRDYAVLYDSKNSW